MEENNKKVYETSTMDVVDATVDVATDVLVSVDEGDIAVVEDVMDTIGKSLENADDVMENAMESIAEAADDAPGCVAAILIATVVAIIGIVLLGVRKLFKTEK